MAKHTEVRGRIELGPDDFPAVGGLAATESRINSTKFGIGHCYGIRKAFLPGPAVAASVSPLSEACPGQLAGEPKLAACEPCPTPGRAQGFAPS
jgi:hypothetical protein